MKKYNNSLKIFIGKLKDPGSAITHFIGMLMAIFAATPLILKCGSNPDKIHIISLSVFILSMILLYAASTLHHSLRLSEKGDRIFKKIDHMMIFVLIAGTYTPICLIALEPNVGIPLLIMAWGIAIGGIIVKAVWINCPKWFSSLLYIAMGWACVLAFSHIFQTLKGAAFGWLLAGGIIYTVGGIIYALKLPIFNNRHKYFGSHEIFHLFVMAGSLCHFILMYSFVTQM